MQARRYNPDLDSNQLSLMFISQAQSPIPPELIPEVGFIVDDLAAGFLYQTDGGFALIENLISNRTSEKDARDRALDAVVSSLIEEAEGLGFAVAIGFTTSSRVLERAVRHGFSADPTPYTMISRRF